MTSDSVEHLEKMLADVRTGMLSAGLRRVALPGKVLQIIDVLTTGDSEKISTLMRDVVGESVSLTAGVSEYGPEAIAAIGVAQSEVYVAVRDQNKTAIPEHKKIAITKRSLSTHIETLLQWVRDGSLNLQLKDPPRDLVGIGRDFLPTPALRSAGIGVYLVAAEIMRTGLEIHY
jgi:hypothetical protein